MGPFRNPLRKHHRGAEHLRTCSQCRAAVERERRYLERLRSAEVPAASTDFTARLLQRTHELAAVSEPPANTGGFAARAVAVCLSGALAMAGLLTGAALLLAGDPTPRAERQTSATAPNLASLAPGGPGGAGSPGSGSFASRSLTATELAALREAGWACPELESLGFSLVSAKAVWWQDAPAIKLHLSRGGYDVTVVEEHTVAGRKPSPVPVSFASGRPASEDGFAAAPDLAVSASGQAGGAEAWIRSTDPVAGIYRSRTTTISYFTEEEPGSEPGPDLTTSMHELARALEAAGQGVYAEAAGKSGTASGEDHNRDEPLADRLGRGFRIMLGLPAQ